MSEGGGSVINNYSDNYFLRTLHSPGNNYVEAKHEQDNITEQEVDDAIEEAVMQDAEFERMVSQGDYWEVLRQKQPRRTFNQEIARIFGIQLKSAVITEKRHNIDNIELKTEESNKKRRL